LFGAIQHAGEVFGFHFITSGLAWEFYKIIFKAGFFSLGKKRRQTQNGGIKTSCQKGILAYPVLGGDIIGLGGYYWSLGVII